MALITTVTGTQSDSGSGGITQGSRKKGSQYHSK
jgi:hypothetical protein